MPYGILKRDGEFCVFKLDTDDQPTGDPLGCHATEAEAEAQQRALYANEPEITNKADALLPDGVRVKAAGDWELDVLGLPFGGPSSGKDAQGEYFDAQTEFHFDKWPLPPVVYYHGFTPDGKPAGRPEYIGKTIRRWVDDAGVWFRVVLDQTSELAQRVMKAAQKYRAYASSGAAPHLVRVDEGGHIAEWPLAEISVFDIGGNRRPANQYAVAVPAMRALWKAAGLELPIDIANQQAADEGVAKGAKSAATQDGAGRQADESTNEEKDMDPKEIAEIAAKAVNDALAARDAQAKTEREEKEKVEAAIKSAVDEVQAKNAEEIDALKTELEAVKAGGRRLPGGASHTMTMPGSKYDYLSPAEHAFALAVQSAAFRSGLRGATSVSEDALRGLALKAISEQDKGNEGAAYAIKALATKSAMMGKPLALKTDEIMHTDLTSYGLEWVEHMYSTDLWEKIRQESWVLQQLEARGNSSEIPDGFDGVNIKLESTDPTWYKVAEVEDLNATTGRPDATITASQFTTGEKVLSVAKGGCRVLFSGELNEDSLIRVAPQAMNQIRISGAEQLEHAVIDGDSDETQYLNVNDVAGTPAGTEFFLLLDGFRKLALVTNTANSRDAGTLADTDFLATAKLMGAAGMNAIPTRCSFLSDMNTYWKSLEMATVKTKDVFTQATIEGGQLTSVYGFSYRPSAFMHYVQASRLANTSGYVDQDTAGNNTTGSILCVRWDQWAWRWKRRMTVETSRYPEADANQIVARLRFGLAYRDTEASAISYDVAVS